MPCIGRTSGLAMYMVVARENDEGEGVRTLAGTKPLAPQASPFDRSGTPSQGFREHLKFFAITLERFFEDGLRW